MTDENVVLDGDDMRRTLVRIAHEIVEKNATGDRADRLAIVGIHRRGAILARRLHGLLSDLLERDVPHGDLDFPVDGMTIVIVDDVLYTGRTVRAAIEALFDYGRPARVQLAVLVDRGHRELPIRPDYVGKNLPTALSERVNVHVAELDGADEVTITSLREATTA